MKCLDHCQNAKINDLIEDYELDGSMFTDLPDKLLDILPAYNDLKQSDKIILILYAEYHSYRKVGKILGVSHSLIGLYIKRIIKELRKC